jgi:Fe-S cluster assembly protein SufB
MSKEVELLEEITSSEYKYGFVTDIEADEAPPGLNEDTIRFISAKKEEPLWMLEWRLKAYHAWLKMTEPTWPNVKYPPVDQILLCPQKEKTGSEPR